MTLHMCEEAAMAAIAVQAARRRPEAPQAHAAMLKPLDPDVVSASIPAFFIGRNKAGLWVAREANGRIGGVFLLKSSAVDFANHQSEPVRCALVFPTESFELDLENGGNPLIVLAARLLEGAKQLLARVITRQRT
ncbi:hypothetical protein AB8Z38_32040 [Bradyrhizobium sp. LLZ17]|uniref:Uncharacterized protein n=2 Tax=Bradyrhizobium sp. LLZ17 TaxID=3239388 RepID=A0AB39XTQ1_9BRAD